MVTSVLYELNRKYFGGSFPFAEEVRSLVSGVCTCYYTHAVRSAQRRYFQRFFVLCWFQFIVLCRFQFTGAVSVSVSGMKAALLKGKQVERGVTASLQVASSSSCLVAKSCPTLCDPMNCSPPGSLSMGILQARLQERVAMPSSRGSSWPGTQPPFLMSPASAGVFFTTNTIWEAWRRLHRRIKYSFSFPLSLN